MAISHFLISSAVGVRPISGYVRSWAITDTTVSVASARQILISAEQRILNGAITGDLPRKDGIEVIDSRVWREKEIRRHTPETSQIINRWLHISSLIDAPRVNQRLFADPIPRKDEASMCMP